MVTSGRGSGRRGRTSPIGARQGRTARLATRRALRLALAACAFLAALAGPASAGESAIAANDVVTRSASLVAGYWARVAPDRVPACGQVDFRWVEPAPEGWGDADGWAYLGGCTIWLSRAHWRIDRPVRNAEAAEYWCNVIAHEWGHLLGFDHDTPIAVMRPEATMATPECRRYYRQRWARQWHAARKVPQRRRHAS
jgi:hypothetical protein